jgi:plastocyanin
MRLFRPMVFFSVVAMTTACMEQGSSPSSTAPSRVTDAGTASPASRAAGTLATAASAMTATVQFGQANVGSGFPPTSGHDQSAHAVDNMVPRTVVIDSGGTVTINTFGVHQVGIYAPGTEPDDIDQSILIPTPAGCPNAPLLMNDANNRVALYAQPCGPGLRQVTHTFDEPGRYLVMCAFLPHFQVQMWGWVIVRD